MQPELELAYLAIEVPDPTSLHAFFGDVIGLVPGEPAPAGTQTWRDDDKAQRLIVQPGPANDAVAIGLEAADADAFDRVAARLTGAGFGAEPAGAADAEQRRVDRLARTMTPWGVPLELVLGLARAAAPFTSSTMPGGFLTDGVGFGHAVFATTNYDDSHRFLTDGLGFGQSDWLQMELAPGFELEVRFYHCNPRHHSIALARAPFDLPQRLHHIMFETNDRDDVGAAFDRAWAAGLAIPNGLGRHDNDKMFSFYVQSPAGFQVEVGHGAVLISDPWTDNHAYDRISAWGHQPLRTEPVTDPTGATS